MPIRTLSLLTSSLVKRSTPSASLRFYSSTRRPFRHQILSFINYRLRNYNTCNLSGSGNFPQPKQVEESSIPSSGLLSVVVDKINIMSGKGPNKDYILPLEQPIVALDCAEAFNGLSEKEKKYAHYLSQASWSGGLAVLVQTSPESPVIFSLLHNIFRTNGVANLKNLAISQAEFTEDEWKALLVYSGGVFFNMGNYKGYGDTKFIPGVPSDKLFKLISVAKFSDMTQEEVKEAWAYAKDRMYSLSEREKQLGLGEKGITTYFSSNCTKEDSDLVVKFMKDRNIEAWNTRCFKTVENGVPKYEIRSASAQHQKTKTEVLEWSGAKFTLTNGDYSPVMSMLNQYLAKAKDFASNETEELMIGSYIKSFDEGKVQDHKDGSRHWIKNISPAIETYIGFIENYRDPTGVRAEFEGFVAVLNRTMSKKFTSLVQQAPDYLKLLPWPTQFEKDVFMKPDFTSLDVLTFSGSGIPAGINIPNYDEIRQNEGFKNVSLGNVIPASYKDSVIPFVSETDKAILDKYRVPSFEVQVALHELLGHGSGKLLKKNEDGSTNYSPDLRNPLTGELIEKCYCANETYDQVFGDFGSAYEECRAECVGIYLSTEKDILKNIFGFEGDEADDIIYANWLSMIYAGAARALEVYQPVTKAWMQAHSQARFAILQVLIEAGEGLVDVKEIIGCDSKPDLVITLDRSKIATVGKKAIRDFLLKIQVYKSTANETAARAMFEGYTKVHDDGKYPWAKWRDIIMEKKQPRKFFVQHNTILNENGGVSLKNYETTPEGLIDSWVQRFEDNGRIYKALAECWKKDQAHF